MQVMRVDVAVIGGGTAGLGARRAVVEAGKSAVLIEGGPWGTTCARVGCMPSKLLIAAAEAAHAVRAAPHFGIQVPDGVRVDGRAVLRRVQAERDRFVGFVLDGVEAIPPEQRLRGHARFVAPTTLQVDDHTRVEARAVVIATGSTPKIPPSLAAVWDAVLTNENAFELADLPESIAVVGTGVIGLEVGQALHRLGVRTTLFARRDLLGPLTDPVVRASVSAAMAAELDIHCNASIAVQRDGGGFLVRWTDTAGGRGERRVAAILSSAGRTPNLADLGLEHTGLALDAQGVPTIDTHTMQCGDAPIFLAGDVSNYRPVLHEAADEGRIAGSNAARFPEVRAQHRRVPLLIAFTEPNLAMVGARFSELRQGEHEVGCVDYGDQGRARVMRQNAGMVRVYATRECGTLIGAEMFGPRVEHTAHLLAWAVQAGLTVEETLDMPFYHPVVEEGIRTALRDLSTRLKLRGPLRSLEECGPGS
ncbi:MAG: dihydrolipoyl dehydrogenase [Deltaproteobacteria bacterium]|nr:dihydrolipoyl dehydrogenase [Deltaproteobacteria bacterium]